MKNVFSWSSRWNDIRFWLVAIAAGLIILHVRLIFLTLGNFPLEMMIFWGAAGYLIWQERDGLRFYDSMAGTMVGCVLIIWVLIRSLAVNDKNTDLVLGSFTPFISSLGLVLMASGFRGIGQYKKVLLMVFLSVFNLDLIKSMLTNNSWGLAIQKFDAAIATIFLWYTGFDVVRQADKIILPDGAVQVNLGCSSTVIVLILIKIALTILMLFKFPRFQSLLVVGSAIVVGFVLNSIRIIMLALLVADKNMVSFEYWHGSEGAEIFSTMGIILVAGVSQLIYVMKDYQVGHVDYFEINDDEKIESD